MSKHMYFSFKYPSIDQNRYSVDSFIWMPLFEEKPELAAIPEITIRGVRGMTELYYNLTQLKRMVFMHYFHILTF